MATHPAIKHKNQRVGVFIDAQNMYYSARHLYNRKVNFGEILKTAVADRQLIRAIAYVVRATGEETPFFEALYQQGIETREREVQVFVDGSKKADWDVGIAVDAIRIGEVLDVVVLVSGDGDFVELVEYLKHHGRQVEALAFKESASQKLIDAVDDFIDLSEEKDRYVLKTPAVRGRGGAGGGQRGARGSAAPAAKKAGAPKTAPKDNRSQRPKKPEEKNQKGDLPKGYFGKDG